MSSTSDTILVVRSRRVFVMRIWVGLMILKFGFWVMGSRAESAESYDG